MAASNFDPAQLRLARQRQRLSTAQTALMLDLSEAAYEAVEQGQGELTDALLQKLALLFRVGLHDLQGKPAPPKKKRKLSKRDREKIDQAERRIDPEYISEEELAEAQQKDPTATRESLRFLKLIASMVVENTLNDLEQQNLLENSPDGFHPERNLPCAICGSYCSGPDAWFDKNGHTCLHCHQAITDGIIPAELTQDADLFFKEVELDIYFRLEKKMINGLIKDKLLKARQIKNKEGKGTHLRIFLHSDNPNFFPPKELLKGGAVEENNEIVFLPWYYFADPNEQLKDYGIAKVMRWG